MRLFAIYFQNGLHSQSECSFGHQVRDYAFMSFSFINESELLNALYLDTDTIFEYILELLPNCFAIVVCYLFLEVFWVGPCNLNGCRCLRYMSEFARV
jgi:hypothetical protein